MVDFVIVASSIFSMSFQGESNLSALKVIRMARLLRPLRVISKNRNLQASIQALVVSLPAILNLLIIVFLSYFIFGIIGVNLLKGKSNYCETGGVTGLTIDEIELLIRTKADCLTYGGTWRRYLQHYDNIGASMTQMLVMS